MSRIGVLAATMLASLAAPAVLALAHGIPRFHRIVPMLSRRSLILGDLVDWLADLIGALRLDRPAAAGHSYGGWIALGARSAPCR